MTCKGGDKAAGIGGSYATRNISNGYYNGDMYGHGVNMHFGSRSNPDYWGGIIAAIGGRNGAGIGAGREVPVRSCTSTPARCKPTAADLLPVLAAAMRVAAVRSIFMVAQSALKAVREALVSAVAAGKRSRI